MILGVNVHYNDCNQATVHKVSYAKLYIQNRAKAVLQAENGGNLPSNAMKRALWHYQDITANKVSTSFYVEHLLTKNAVFSGLGA